MQSKFPIGWIFAIIAALIVGALTFFSSNFQYRGENIGISTIIAVVVALCLLFIVFLLIKVKKVSIPLNFRKAAAYETILLLVYIFVAFFSAISMNHFYSVMGRKETIQKEVKNQISQMDQMFDSYIAHADARVQAYEASLRSIDKNKKNNHSAYVNAQLNRYTIDQLLTKFSSEISCGDMQANIQKWEEKMEQRTKGLGLIRLMPRIQEINETLNSTREELIRKDQGSELGLNGPHWTYTLTVGNDILKQFAKEDGEEMNLWALLTALFAALVIALPYIAAERDGRNRGLFWELSHNRDSSSTNNGGVVGGI